MNQKKNENRNENENKLSLPLSSLTIYVLQTSNLRYHIFFLHYDIKVAECAGQWKILELVSQNYWWP